MSLSMYRVSVPVFVRGLGVLSTLLEKASAHAQEHGIPSEVLINARLAPTMMPFSAQVQRASDTSKLAIERLTGIPSPHFADKETTFVELQERIDRTITYLESIDEAELETAETRTVTLSFGEFKPVFRGDDYLLSFAIPNFFFHVTTAHDILRHNGVGIGKRDYLGPYSPPAPPQE
ncbi:DUF1993 domain-containing protein [Undibacterium sp.]|jgi:hypothetical protein|uniref:DUF1993 domain-containing protein n=1 Tax=Undibacterium sp. TaxID=1914977 RepID=UPI002C8735A5|nr:DUF1993 domain-containing protein [Undibacterium sp.]HTD03435.1 DUF1993 domain-containing protein [Undibacterium sp.]